MIDLLVAGGGPAGLATAIEATLAGMQVVVVEPRPGVIDKACGEGLMPPAVEGLARLGVEPAISFPLVGIRYIEGDAVAEAHFDGGPGLGVRRTVLHAALRDRAAELGVNTIEGRVTEFHQDDDVVEAAGVRARWLVAADGLRSPIRRALDLGLPPRLPPRMGLRAHFSVLPWAPLVEVHWSPVAEAYVTPVADDLVGVAFLWTAPIPSSGGGRRPFDRLLSHFPALSERLVGEPASHARGAGPFEQRVRSRVAGRVLLVGDAAGYLDPLTGEGVRLALDAARAAVACIVAERPEDYEREWRQLARPYWMLTGGLLWLARHPLSRRRIVPVARRFPGLMTSALSSLQR